MRYEISRKRGVVVEGEKVKLDGGEGTIAIPANVRNTIPVGRRVCVESVGSRGMYFVACEEATLEERHGPRPEKGN